MRYHGRNNNMTERKNKMSKENIQKFYELLKQDPAVVNDLKKAVEGADNTGKASFDTGPKSERGY